MMKRAFLILSFVLFGSATGYYIAYVGGYPRLVLILVTSNGGFLGYWFGMALIWKKYGTLIWGFATLLVAVFVDWVAGSTVTMANKLAFAGLGLFFGWNFWRFRKQVLFGGFVGGAIGLVRGMNNSHWFGNVQLEPGFLNAILQSVQFFIFGMALGSLYMHIIGWRFLSDHSEL